MERCNGAFSDSDRIGFALFGAGRIGKVHFKNLFLHQNVNLLYIIEEETSRAHALTERYQIQDKVKVGNMEEAQQVYDDPRVEAVMICTPSFTHETLILKALNAGKSVFCEKPLAPSMAASKTCYDTAASKGLTLFCAFNRRFDPQLQKIYKSIKCGKLGTLRKLTSTSRDPPTTNKDYFRTSGGIFIDSCVHDIDLQSWLVGEKPESVYVTGHATDPVFAEFDDVDTCVITLKFPCGAIGSIEVSREAYVGYDQRIEVFGSKGSMESGNKRPLDLYHTTLDGSLHDPIYTDCCDRYAQSYQAELDHFVSVLRGEEELGVTSECTLAVNLIAEACKESLKTGNAVKLNYDHVQL